ncbi:zeaxanthin epoxidase, chloroplastic-like [Impatiens glandulifera]|uniref:zeaxanthin epoxidase, chloroplastic-like n=1 Tax=Impatiens glandulifera TaxID=253017 RepID=UPI001FB0E9DF|nr:zeaxanthin epoxidase, chloroplastic-like [Impatiens glandulifera]
MASFQSINSFSHQYQGSINFPQSKRIDLTRRRTLILTCERKNEFDFDQNKSGDTKKKNLRILIAGGGIGGLVFALAAKKRGYDVKVFERDLSAIRGEGNHRGPIQLLSSALAVLESIDVTVAKQVMDAGCVTGDRINGLADGVTGDWFVKLDLLNPAIRRGLPVTRVICRMALQDILVNAVGDDIVKNKSKVVDFVEESNKVRVILENGQHYEGDLLIGADGIWSKVRSRLFGAKDPSYSSYTCYSGLTEFVPPYIDSVGYRVFLGLDQYFVASDVGNGKMQWYAFHKEAPMNAGTDDGVKKKRLLELFGNWCGDVTTLIAETPEAMILHRDIYDRDMLYRWGAGLVTLLGDAAHPMQPNLGQGGCMAIEDCYSLILELDKITKLGSGDYEPKDIISALRRYEWRRIPRVSIVHNMSRMTSKILSSYKPYVKIELGLFSFLPSKSIAHPAIPAARMIVQTFLPIYLNWMIAGTGFW